MAATTIKYTVVFEKSPDNWSAHVPDLPGFVTTGKTLDEARDIISDAIRSHIEAMRLVGEEIPEPSTVADTVEIAAGQGEEGVIFAKLRIGYIAVFTKNPNGYSAHVPDLPGCIAAAPSLAQTKALMESMVVYHRQSLLNDNQPLPRRSSVASLIRKGLI